MRIQDPVFVAESKRAVIDTGIMLTDASTLSGNKLRGLLGPLWPQ